MVSWIVQHDCFDTCCFECLICMRFVFASVQRNWACFTWKGALEIRSLLLLLFYRDLAFSPTWNKHRVFKNNVLAVLLCGSETWHVSCTLSNKLQIFINTCLRNILKIRWPEKLENTDLCAQAKLVPYTQEITTIKWRWTEYTRREQQQKMSRAWRWIWD